MRINRKILKKITGINLMLLVLLYGINSNSVVTIQDEYIIYSDHLDVDLEEEVKNVSKATHVNEPVSYSKTKSDEVDLKKRYSSITMYSHNDYIQNFIDANKELVIKTCNKEGIPPSIAMAIIILENVDAQNKRLAPLAANHHNYNNIKYKSGKYFSSEFAKFMELATEGTVQYKDDCVDLCDFYKFKSKWFGMTAGIKFLADRIENHPQYSHLKGVTDVEEFAYGIYLSNYAKKDLENPHDKKIIRVIRQYDLKNM